MNALDRLARRVDEIQQGSSWLAFGYAVSKKFGDDLAGNLAGLMAYYAFISIFPLFLVFATVLGWILQDNTTLQADVLRSALSDFPVIGDQLKTVGLVGHWYTLVVSLAISVWGAQGVARATQTALNTVWAVPFVKRPGMLSAALRNMGMLGVMAFAVLTTGLLSGVGSSNTSLAVATRVGAIAVSLAITIGAALVAFRLATAPQIPMRDFAWSAVISATAYQVLLAAASLLLTHTVRHQTELYGTFGVVLGLLAWLHLQARITLYAVEADVVRVRHLYPRSSAPPPLTRADRRAYRAYAQTTMRRPEEEIGVEVSFPETAPADVEASPVHEADAE